MEEKVLNDFIIFLTKISKEDLKKKSVKEITNDYFTNLENEALKE